MKNKGCLITIGTLIVILTLATGMGIWVVSIRNSFIAKEELIKNKWSKVESAYQRRSDLIPNLMNTVKGYAKFEQETLTRVIEARAKATQIKVDPTQLTPTVVSKFQQNQDGLSSALGRLLISIERYPELKANQSFLELQSELAGTENRIKIERDQFNDAVMEYNKEVRLFPNDVIANLFGFSKKASFKSVIGSENPPKIDF